MAPKDRLSVRVEARTVERLREIAKAFGFVARSGPNAKRGNISAMLDAIGSGELDILSFGPPPDKTPPPMVSEDVHFGVMRRPWRVEDERYLPLLVALEMAHAELLSFVTRETTEEAETENAIES